jgi:hypothetical protein
VITECLVSPVSSPTHLAWREYVVDMEWIAVNLIASGVWSAISVKNHSAYIISR